MATATAVLITMALTQLVMKDHHGLTRHPIRRVIQVVLQAEALGAVEEAVVVEALAAGRAADKNNQEA